MRGDVGKMEPKKSKTWSELNQANFMTSAMTNEPFQVSKPRNTLLNIQMQ